MGIFKKKMETIDNNSGLANVVEPIEPKKETIMEEDWVWIEGYKATNKDMKCRGFQFELGKMFTYEGTLVGCKSGFHLCPELKDCFDYYEIGHGNRYFKVRALINIHQTYSIDIPSLYFPHTTQTKLMIETDKRVAKKIEFLEEVSPEEIIKIQYPDSYQAMSEKLKMNIIQYGPGEAFKMQSIDELKETNIYSTEMVNIIVAHNKIALAYALAKENVSQDTRLNILFK